MADDNDRMPWFRFFGRDFLGDPDIQELSLEEQGALVRLWASYCATGRPLPGDLERASRMTQVPVDLLGLLLPRHFEENENGDWFSPRMDREQGRDATRSEKAAKAAKARWDAERKKRDRKDSGGSPDGPGGGSSTHMPNACDEHAPSTCTEDASSNAGAHAQSMPQSQIQSQSTHPVPEPDQPTDPPPNPSPQQAYVRNSASLDPGGEGGRADRPVDGSQDPPPDNGSRGRILNLARRRAGPSRPVPAGRVVGEALAGLDRLRVAGGAS